MAKLTIEDLLAQKERGEVTETSVHLDSLGGELEIRKIPLVKFNSYMARAQKGDPEEMVEAQYEMIYACCPILHNRKLQEAYECKDPLDIVPRVFRENMVDLNTITSAITKFYGYDLDEALKN